MSINYFWAFQHCLAIPGPLKNREPIPPVPEEVGEYNPFFQRCFDYDLRKRPDIDEMIDMLNEIKASYNAEI